MRESIGGTQLFMIVIALVIIFASLMALTINHSNAFTVKDQLVTIIEKNGGFDMTEYIDPDGTHSYAPLADIVDSLKQHSYRQTGKCPETPSGEEGKKYKIVGYDRDGRVTSGKNKSSFCIVRIAGDTGRSGGGVPTSYYYQVVVFYNLDIPFFNQVFNFKAIGETKILFH